MNEYTSLLRWYLTLKNYRILLLSVAKNIGKQIIFFQRGT